MEQQRAQRWAEQTRWPVEDFEGIPGHIPDEVVEAGVSLADVGGYSLSMAVYAIWAAREIHDVAIR